MPEMAFNELADAAHLYITNFAMGSITCDAKLTVRGSSVNSILIKNFTESRPECAMPKRSASLRAEQLLRQAESPYLPAKNRIACAQSVAQPEATVHRQ